jgi:hypothetical protein
MRPGTRRLNESHPPLTASGSVAENKCKGSFGKREHTIIRTRTNRTVDDGNYSESRVGSNYVCGMRGSGPASPVEGRKPTTKTELGKEAGTTGMRWVARNMNCLHFAFCKRIYSFPFWVHDSVATCPGYKFSCFSLNVLVHKEIEYNKSANWHQGISIHSTNNKGGNIF